MFQCKMELKKPIFLLRKPHEDETLKDEFCSNKSFEKEKASDDNVVEKILVTADCQADWSDQVVTKFVDEKLTIIGIRVQSIK